jgi:hypothetical protein
MEEVRGEECSRGEDKRETETEIGEKERKGERVQEESSRGSSKC